MIRVRVDLRTHLVSAGIVCPFEKASEPVACLLQAREIWRGAGQRAPLAIAVNTAACANLGHDLKQAGLDPRAVQLEFEEHDVVSGGFSHLERLRARGYAIVLRCAADFPAALDTRARKALTAIAMPVPAKLDSFFDLDGWRVDKAARRVQTAQHAGLVCIASNVVNGDEAEALVKAGFKEAEGPYAIAPRPYTAARAGRAEMPSSFSSK
jgi:hypothetical protein